MEIRKAKENDIDIILTIMDKARGYQRSLGFCQWEDGYPNSMVIAEDIELRVAYVFTIDDRVVGYSVLQIGDSAYDTLIDTWQYDGIYGVVHRLAFDESIRGKGFSKKAFELIESNFKDRDVKSIRIDTGESNVVMQHILERTGYLNLGICMFPWGRRIAYEKNIF